MPCSGVEHVRLGSDIIRNREKIARQVNSLSKGQVIYVFEMNLINCLYVSSAGNNLSSIIVLAFKTHIINQNNEQEQTQKCPLWAPTWKRFDTRHLSFILDYHSSIREECNDYLQQPSWYSHVTEFGDQEVMILPVKGF